MALHRDVRVCAAALLPAAALLLCAPLPGVLAADLPQGPASVHEGPAEGYNGSYFDGQIHAYHVQGNVWVMAGERGDSNVTVQVGDEGVLVVDTGVGPMAGKLLAQIRQLAAERAGDQKTIRLIINTDGSPDHIGGNEVIREGGSTIVAGNVAIDNPGHENGATVMADQNVLMRLVTRNAAGEADSAQPLWPTDTEDFDVYDTAFNGEAVQLFHPHLATSDGNLLVQFRHSDVIATGDTVDMISYPRIDTDRGGTIDGELVALNKITDMAVPAAKEEGGTAIIPGHGRVCDRADVEQYKNILTVIRNRIQYYKNQGRTLPQVLALKPSQDFDQRWGSGADGWNAQRFVTAVYQTLPARGPSFSMQTETVVPATAGVTAGRAY